MAYHAGLTTYYSSSRLLTRKRGAYWNKGQQPWLFRLYMGLYYGSSMYVEIIINH